MAFAVDGTDLARLLGAVVERVPIVQAVEDVHAVVEQPPDPGVGLLIHVELALLTLDRRPFGLVAPLADAHPFEADVEDASERTTRSRSSRCCASR